MPKKKKIVKKTTAAKQTKRKGKKPAEKKASGKPGKIKPSVKLKPGPKAQDLTADEWIKGKQAEINAEFKKYSPDLEPRSGKTADWCARTAMTLAHHGTPEAIAALKKFKSDPRAPVWIDCAIEECEMILWDDTTGKRINQAEKSIRQAAEKVMAEKLTRDKDAVTGALKQALEEDKVDYSYGKTVKLLFNDKVIGEDKAEFIIGEVLLIGIKPAFADWLVRFREGREGKDLRRGDLENIEQGMQFNEEGEKLSEPHTLEESFNDFYEQQFYNILKMSECYIGYLLDFSGERIYGKFFSRPYKNGVEFGNCSGWCPDCLEELKCETAREMRESEDKKRYRILKRLIKEIVEIEDRMHKAARPAADWRYLAKIAEQLKNETESEIKKEKNKTKRDKLEEELKEWDTEASVLRDMEKLERPAAEDKKRLARLRLMYAKIKNELETNEYKNDTEGLEVYYGKAEPSSEENAAAYHDPLCDCDEYEPLLMDEYFDDDFYDADAAEDEIKIENIPF